MLQLRHLQVIFRRMKLLAALPSLLFLTAACAPTRPPTISWDQATLRLIDRGGSYGRMARLADGTIACAFDRDSKMWILHSLDDGRTWSDAILVAQDPDCWLTNADLLPLADASLLYFYDERPHLAVKYQNNATPPVALTRPFRIRMARSNDNGRTWSPPQTLYSGGTNFHDGCWEPAAVQLPSGEIHVYFANEAVFPNSDEQEIALLCSRDNGRTWSDAQRVSYRKGHRDGMPAPLVLAAARGIVVAVEDNGIDDAFKPAIVFTSLKNNWRDSPVTGESPRRRSALAQPLPRTCYAGAPCLRQLPSGFTLLSFQESPDGTLEHCRMAVCIGDRDACGFTNKTYPFPPPTRGNQLWNALFVKDATTVTAITSATFDGVHGLWSIDGQVTPSQSSR
jgi:hypothetical protein